MEILLLLVCRLAALRLKLLDEALRAFGRCSRVVPADPGPRIQLAACRTELGDSAGAAAVLEALAAEHPAEPALLLRLAGLYVR